MASPSPDPGPGPGHRQYNDFYRINLANILPSREPSVEQSAELLLVR